MKKFVVVFLVLILIGSVAGCGSKGSDTVKIGFLGALTGDVAMYGQPTLAGMKMAVEEINKAGGIDGKKLEIVEADNRGDKQEAANIVQKFVSRDKVVAIVGDPTTGITKVAAPICERNKVLLISAGSTGTGVVELGKFIFRDTLLDSVAVPALVDYFITNEGFKKIAVITSDNNDYSVGLTEVFKKAIEGKELQVVADEKVKDGDKDFSAQITNIKSKNPDLIFFSGYYTEGALLMKEARKQGLNINMFGGDGLYSPTLITLGGSSIEGSMVYVGFSPEQPTPETEKFIEAYKAANKDTIPGLFEAQGYDAIVILAEAMKRAKSTDPKKFRDEVATTKEYKGVSGTITFLDNQEPIKSPVYLLEVKNGQYTLKTKVPVEVK